MDRREFLETSGVLAGGAMLGGIPSMQSPKAPPMIGIQVGAVSFVDEGTDRVLDSLRELASINTLFVATFTYGRGIAGRQLPNQPLPDHGKQEYDTATFRGGNYATPHPEYYKNTSIAPERAPDHPNYDVLADVLPRAGPNLKIWPGIDVDIPTAATSKKTQPSDVYEAVKAAFAGVLLSRKYSEMRLDNIRGAGQAIRELKLV
jgi:hypothetical protein